MPYISWRHSAVALTSVTLTAGLLAGAGSPPPATAEPDRTGIGASSREGPNDDIAGFGEDAVPDQAALERLIQDSVDPKSASQMSEAMSTYTGRVGTPGAQRRVDYSVQKLQEWGLDPQVEEYDVYASRPQDISLTMTAPTERELAVKEPPFPWHQDFDDVVMGYNAYSPAGHVSDDIVFVNYGLPEDYAKLDELGVDVKGKIVLAKYGQSFRGVKSQVAEEHGAAGVVLYSDPEDDGFGKGKVYPEGPWRNADQIQRGSVQYIFKYPGDPLTPGEPSTAGTDRLDPSEAGNMPAVPTTPISYGQARYLLKALEGPVAPEEWQGGLNFEYHVGPGPTKLDMDLDIDYEQIPVKDVVVEIPGVTHPEEKVVLGAHFDSWTYGTGDDVSGWVTTMEAAKALSEALKTGWRPDRTIVLAGWDGEEYGLLGSTEWAEQHRADLLDNAVTYLNLDGAGGGKNFGASSVPALDGLITDVAKTVEDPEHGTLFANWQQASDDKTPTPERLGSGSDYTAFLDHLGIASADVGMNTPNGDYHSAYDDLYMMRNFKDPGYTYHAVNAAFVGIFASRLADAQTLPMDYTGYGTEVRSYLKDLDKAQKQEQVVDLQPAYKAAKQWSKAAAGLQQAAETAVAEEDQAALGRINQALTRQERVLTQEAGLPGRPWFKHMIYAPGFYTGYAVQPLAAIDDAIQDGDTETAEQYRDLLVDSMTAARDEARSGIPR